MPRKSEKLYVSQQELIGAHGRAAAVSSAASQSQYQNYVPFSSCAISLQPWSTPVADRNDGTIYELTNILPWIQRHGLSPASGQELKPADLVPLKFAKNEATGQWHDPVSFKAFNDSTHLVAITTSGNVFAHDTVHQLNVKAKYWSDLVSGETFARKDILTLQDPSNIAANQQKAADLQRLKDKMRRDVADRDEVNISATGSAGNLLRKLKEQKEAGKREKEQAGDKALAKMEAAREESRATKNAEASTSASAASSSSSSSAPSSSSKAQLGRSTGLTAASLTSTSLSIRTANDRELISEEETMYSDIKAGHKSKKGAHAPYKGYVRLVTNFGPLNLELHCDRAPKTCYNFLTLCRRGKYTGTVFHRNIPGFMIQGGDPTGTGTGGESMWGPGKPFGDELSSGADGHSSRGCLSMANRGPSTNTSQFFLTYAPKSHLDKKHTVFGRLVDEPSATLDSLESVPTDSATDKPLRTVTVLDVQIFSDPFQDWWERRKSKEQRGTEAEAEKREEKRRKREGDRITWFGTKVGEEGQEEGLEAIHQASGGVGKYLALGAGARSVEDDAEPESMRKKRKKAAAGDGEVGTPSFGDFSDW